MRIFHAIQHDKKVEVAAFVSKQIIKIAVLFLCRNRDYTLMAAGFRQASELVARHRPHRNTAGAAQLHNLPQPIVSPPGGHGHIFKPPASRRQCLFHCMDSVDEWHLRKYSSEESP